MANVILFRPIYDPQAIRSMGARPPLGLLLIADHLLKNNYTVKIIDGVTNAYWPAELIEAIDDTTICAGVSAMTGAQISEGLIFSKMVKDHSGIPVVWGGLHASMLPEQTLGNDLIDIVVEGEGEEVLLKIAAALKEGNSLCGIQNTFCKENGRIYSNPKGHFMDLNNQPFLATGLIDYEKYINTRYLHMPGCRRTFELNTDRGCPHGCAFCYNIHINKSRWRGMTASRIVEHAEYLVNTFDLDGINFISDNFFVDKKRVFDICVGIIQKRIKIGWHADIRVDYFVKYEDSFINLLKESGCRMLTFGVESGSEKVLRDINKCIKLEDVYRVNEKMKRHGMGAAFHFMAGFPGETREDVFKTFKIMYDLSDRNPALEFWGGISIYTPYPGTPLYEKCIKLGFKPPEKLEDWIDFDWNKINLNFLTRDYRMWLMDVCGKLIWNCNFKMAWYRKWAIFWIVWLRTRLSKQYNAASDPTQDFVSE